MEPEIQRRTTVLIALYIGALVASNLLGNKIAEVFGIVVAVGILSYPITFLVTDIIAEVHGKRASTDLVIAGVTTLVFLLLLTAVSVALPAAARDPYGIAYADLFGSTLRIMVASLVSFGLSQTYDVWAFHFFKEKTHGRHLWLRNNASTMASQFVDSVVFMFIAFYAAAPQYTVGFIISLIIPYWLLKVAAAALDTPFCYVGVRWLRGWNREQG